MVVPCFIVGAEDTHIFRLLFEDAHQPPWVTKRHITEAEVMVDWQSETRNNANIPHGDADPEDCTYADPRHTSNVLL